MVLPKKKTSLFPIIVERRARLGELGRRLAATRNGGQREGLARRKARRARRDARGATWWELWTIQL